MEKAILKRTKSKDVTFGRLHLQGIQHPDIYTIELPWQNNAPKISCIPGGAYKVIPYSSVKYKNVWHVLDVPNRTAILIHIGNYASCVGQRHPDTEGCILVGFGIDDTVPMITRSKECVDYLRGFVKEFTLEIVDA